MNTTFVEAVFNNLANLIPCKVIHSYERGVKFRGGVPKAELRQGIHWFWPFYESIEVVNTSDEVKDLPSQSVTTKDGHAITFSANICYCVINATDNYTKVQAFDEAMQGFAMVYLARAIRAMTLTQLKSQQERLESDFTIVLRKKVKRWGAKVVWCGITDLVVSKAYRLFGDSPVL